MKTNANDYIIEDAYHSLAPEEYVDYIIKLYDLYLTETEKRSISYGEINYIANLEPEKIKALENELILYFETSKR